MKDIMRGKDGPKGNYTVAEFRSYHLPDYFPVLLLTGEHWKISDIPTGRLHFHNCLEIGICHSGSGVLDFYSESLGFEAGDVTCIPKNMLHTTCSSAGEHSMWSYLFLDPGKLFGSMLPGDWKNTGPSAKRLNGRQCILKQENASWIYALVMQVISEMLEEAPGYQISTRGLLLSLYIELCRRQNRAASQVRDAAGEGAVGEALVLTPALEYIEANYMEAFPIETLANLCGWSTTHFRRVFLQIMGMTPLEYINYVRITSACNMLCTTEDSILSISENVGFGSVSSFNRNFKRSVKISPRDYRKQIADTVLKFNGWLAPEE